MAAMVGLKEDISLMGRGDDGDGLEVLVAIPGALVLVEGTVVLRDGAVALLLLFGGILLLPLLGGLLLVGPDEPLLLSAALVVFLGISLGGLPLNLVEDDKNDCRSFFCSLRPLLVPLVELGFAVFFSCFRSDLLPSGGDLELLLLLLLVDPRAGGGRVAVLGLPPASPLAPLLIAPVLAAAAAGGAREQEEEEEEEEEEEVAGQHCHEDQRPDRRTIMKAVTRQ